MRKKRPKRLAKRSEPNPESKILKAFAEELLLLERRSTRTVQEYISDLWIFSRFVAESGNPDAVLKRCTISDIRQFIMDMTRRELSAAAVRRRAATLRTFFAFAKKHGFRSDNLGADIGRVKLPGRLPKSISVDATARLLDTKPVAGRVAWQKRRDAAILELLYATGIRRAELVGIDLSDLDFDNRTLRVIGKGNKERRVFFNPAAADALRRYLELRPRCDEGALFVSRLGRRLSYPQVGNIFHLYVKLSGLEGKITPHTMRHSFATHLIQRGVDIMTVKELLGHENVSTTQVYSKVTLEHMRQAYEEAHPRNRKGRMR